MFYHADLRASRCHGPREKDEAPIAKDRPLHDEMLIAQARNIGKSFNSFAH